MLNRLNSVVSLLLVVSGIACAVLAQETSQAALSLTQKLPLTQQAWDLLREGATEKSTEHRASAVRSLSLLQGESRAITLAMHAMEDLRPEVRSAAATALGELHATSGIPKLKDALADKNLTVVLAAAHSLITLKDSSPYEVYYALLSGDRKNGKGLISDQLSILKDPKKMAMLGFHEGMGYIPFGDIGFTAVRTIMKDSSAPLRAAAAKGLADDPDPVSQNMLMQSAVADKSELVRVAALEAVAKHGDSSAIDKISGALTDSRYSVRCAAAAAILHLDDLTRRKTKKRK